MSVPLWSWFAVGAVIAVLLAVDLAANRGGRVQTLRRAVVASVAWITVSVAFGVILGFLQGSDVAQQYFAGYLLEKSLSIDNIFVFVLLFRAFAVPAAYQHRVLYYGVLGALVLRAGFIAGGAALLDRFDWVFYVFGAFLVLAGVRMLRGETEVHPQRNLLVRGIRALVPVTPDYVGDRFGTRVDGRLFATPLLVALVAIEATDIVFATDSIPAIFGVTRNVFVVFTSNAFAVLGLRALYFVFADAMDRFRYLKYGLSAILVFIGVKMLVDDVAHVSVGVSLGVIAVAVAASMAASVWQARRELPEAERRQHR